MPCTCGPAPGEPARALHARMLPPQGDGVLAATLTPVALLLWCLCGTGAAGGSAGDGSGDSGDECGTSPPLTVLDLPLPEVIFSFLDPLSLARCTCVCK